MEFTRIGECVNSADNKVRVIFHFMADLLVSRGTFQRCLESTTDLPHSTGMVPPVL
jgi:hypothetical protein